MEWDNLFVQDFNQYWESEDEDIPDPTLGYFTIGAYAGNNISTFNGLAKPVTIRSSDGCGFGIASFAVLPAWRNGLQLNITGQTIKGNAFTVPLITLESVFDDPTIVDLTSYGQMSFLRFETFGGTRDPSVFFNQGQMTATDFTIIGVRIM